MINGSHFDVFTLEKGLRQCDYLTPFMFILIMEEFEDAKAARSFYGIQVGVSDMCILICHDAMIIG